MNSLTRYAIRPFPKNSRSLLDSCSGFDWAVLIPIFSGFPALWARGIIQATHKKFPQITTDQKTNKKRSNNEGGNERDIDLATFPLYHGV